MTNQNDDFLDDVFAQARLRSPTPSADLMARILSDAADEQVRQRRARPEPVDLGRWLFDTLGGWPAFGGLVTAGIAGVWIGLAPQVPIESFTGMSSTDTVTIDLWQSPALFDLEFEADG